MASKELTVLQWNCRSIKANKLSLIKYISINPVDVIVLSETWLQENDTFDIRGFNNIRRDRRDGKAGVAIFISHKITFSEINLSNNFSGNIMACAVHLNSPYNINIMSVYKPPNSQATYQDWQNLFQQCNQSECIICGDFNIHSLSWGCHFTDNNSAAFIDALDDLQLVLLNDGSPTHIWHRGKPSAIDLSITTANIAANFTWEVVDDTLGSDHFPILLKRAGHSSNPMIIYPTSKWNIKQADWYRFKNLIEKQFSSTPIFSNANDMYVFFLESINIVAEKVFKIKKPFVPKHKTVCWWDEVCNNAVKLRKEALTVYKNNPTADNFIHVKKVCADTKKLLKGKARQSWKEFCENLNTETAPKRIWSQVKAMKHSHSVQKCIPPDTLTELLQALAPDSVNLPNALPDTLDSENFLVQPFSLQELEKALKKDVSTAPGSDNVLYPMLIIIST